MNAEAYCVDCTSTVARSQKHGYFLDYLSCLKATGDGGQTGGAGFGEGSGQSELSSL